MAFTLITFVAFTILVAVLWPIELVIMAIMNKRNKKAHPDMQAWNLFTLLLNANG